MKSDQLYLAVEYVSRVTDLRLLTVNFALLYKGQPSAGFEPASSHTAHVLDGQVEEATLHSE